MESIKSARRVDRLETERVRSDGRRVSMSITISPIKDEAGRVVGASKIARDVTRERQVEADRRRAEESLRMSEERLRLAQHVAHVGTFEWNVQTGESIWTPELEQMHGLQPRSFEGNYAAWEQLVYKDDRAAAGRFVRQAFETDEPVEGEWRVQWADGSLHWIVGRYQLLRDDKGQPARLLGVNIDITTRRMADEELRRSHDELERRVAERTRELAASLQEKNVLLREIHHRVTNNLAFVTSLFALQSAESGDERVIRALRDSEGRVRAMALVHRTLYASSDLAAVEFSDYARALTQQLVGTFAVSPAIQFTTELQPVTLSIEMAIPCGLILNELISNAFKHAFPGGRPGRIVIALAPRADGRMVLRVRDDGVGIAAAQPAPGRSSLGLTLVRSLVNQIRADFEMRDAQPGLEVLVTFPPLEQPAWVRASV